MGKTYKNRIKCKKCIEGKSWCRKICLRNYLKSNFSKWTSGNEVIDDFIREMQLKINNGDGVMFEWVPYDQFREIKVIGKGGFATVYAAIWKDGPLICKGGKYESRYLDGRWERSAKKKIALKCFDNCINIPKEFLNEVKAYSRVGLYTKVLSIYGITQKPDTKEYVMVLEYADRGSLTDWVNMNYKDFDWSRKLDKLVYIFQGLKEIHKHQMVHRDIHTGNLLFKTNEDIGGLDVRISDMGLCGKVGDMDEKSVYGVMPYIAPEVLRGEPYTQAADIYSFGMIMYFIATTRQPFQNCSHDEYLALNICMENKRPEINGFELPECYVDLMRKCWDSDPKNRPDAMEIGRLIHLFHRSYTNKHRGSSYEEEIKQQFEEAEKRRKINPSLSENYQSATHPQATYTSRLLNNYFIISEGLGLAI
ncbi:kinase-like domain-containing protein [Rhizophagus clarus]|uniref:Kinase-like domain-containing protein n=1 Tax=Rhizophagus clarus TaxID=94130 RepID=A0A8H3QDN3_9GLOM|nr:kinase-like domain-containing protein [Rhizophagus clarus]